MRSHLYALSLVYDAQHCDKSYILSLFCELRKECEMVSRPAPKVAPLVPSLYHGPGMFLDLW